MYVFPMFEHLKIYLSIVFLQGKTIHFIDKVVEQNFQDNVIGICKVTWRIFEIAVFIFVSCTALSFDGEFTEEYQQSLRVHCGFLLFWFAVYLSCTFITYKFAIEWQNKKLDSDKGAL